MTPFAGNDRRRIVPRWRSPHLAVASGEVVASATSTRVVLPNLALEQAQATEEWSQRPVLGTAAELVAASLLIAPNEAALEAAQFILADPITAGPLLVRRAQALVGNASNRERFSAAYDRAEGSELSPEHASSRSRIRPLKARVLADPHDSLAWLEMGRIHATTGNRERAERAVLVALGIAGQSRLVVRSAARFFLHAGDPEFAHEVLRRNARTRHDPWLSAAEIAAAQVAMVAPRTIRTGTEMVRGGRFNDHELSELRGALATVALTDGKRKDVRLFLSDSLRDPTENAVAQALWIARQAEIFDVATMVQNALATPGSFEARSFAAYNRGEWESAFTEALRWIADEPYSGRAASHAAVVAGVALDRHDEAIAILRAGLRASPGTLSLMGNLVYNLAIGGRVDDAVALAREYRPAANEHRYQIIGLANQGLIDFRSGRPATGRLAYAEAIRLAVSKQERELEELAGLYLLTEELHANNMSAVPQAIEALAKVQVKASAEYRLVGFRLLKEVDRLRSLPGPPDAT